MTTDQSPTPRAPGAAPSDSDPNPVPPRRALRDLFLVAFLILFWELACIRWLGATVAFLTFFTNIVLMACVLGMSVGCLSARAEGWRDWRRLALPFAIAVALLALLVQSRAFGGQLVVRVGNPAAPAEVFYGAEDQPGGGDAVPIELLAGVVFLLTAAWFVGLGQVMGRAFAAIPNPLVAYTADIAGALCGIVAFTAFSAIGLPPWTWFLAGAVFWCLLVPPPRWIAPPLAAILVLLVALSGEARKFPGSERFWSPYYKIEHDPRTRIILTNNIGHQTMEDVTVTGQRYSLPHLLRRDAVPAPDPDSDPDSPSASDLPPDVRPPGVGPGPGDVLIIGGGSGNDVAAALANGATRVDVVEIDPVILRLGRRDHPNRPYDDPRVHVVLDDGRGFLKRAERRYDTIVFALVDSLVLHSGYSSLRLESFLYTMESLREARDRLKPGGVLVMSNYFRQGWIVARLRAMLAEVFGSEPVVISLPHREVVDEGAQTGYFTIFLAGGVDSIREAFEPPAAAAPAPPIYFWSLADLALQRRINGYAPEPPSVAGVGAWTKVGPSRVVVAPDSDRATDDWPFIYLRTPSIPALNLRGVVVVAALSVGLLLLVAPSGLSRFNPRMFFLGAGFMLLETKGVVHMALLFGSTWWVNAVVFFAVLVMVLLANLAAQRYKPKRLEPWYGLLFAALCLNLAVPTGAFLALAEPAKTLASTAVVFVPIFFAGVVFSAEFRRSERPDADFGSNVAGIVLGGLSEYASLLLGFDGLLGLVILYYALSAWAGRGLRAPRLAPR